MSLAWILKVTSYQPGEVTMDRYRAIGFVATCIAALACDQQREVQQEAQELREAQNRVGNVTAELQADLDRAKAEVVRLEEKLAMARQGITDEVLSERKELQESLKEQEREVTGEVQEAKREAQKHNEDSAQAARELEKTAPPAKVEAKVSTETQVVERTRTPVQTTERQELIPVRGTSAADAGTNAERTNQPNSPAAPR
jgi:chromosome segregation ATPase